MFNSIDFHHRVFPLTTCGLDCNFQIWSSICMFCIDKVSRQIILLFPRYCVRYWFALLGNASLILALKKMLAIPRPHFIDTCNPDWDLVNCSQNGGQVGIKQNYVQKCSTLCSAKTCPSISMQHQMYSIYIGNIMSSDKTN